MKKIVFVLMLALGLTSCTKDTNNKPTYGETGLPKNCRAIIGAVISEYRKVRDPYAESYEELDYQLSQIDSLIESADKNCGLYGTSWGQ